MPRLARTLAFVALTLALGVASPARAQQRARNVVFILTDDHRYDAMSFMGHPIVQTPSIDRIAKRGVHLRNAFVTTALCSPSRATILTGLYAHQHKVVTWATSSSATSRRSWASTTASAACSTTWKGRSSSTRRS